MNERDIFQAAVEIEDPAERASFLEKACGNQPDLKSHVETLLKYYEDAGSFLERPPAELKATLVSDDEATDENSLAPTYSPDHAMSDEALLSYLTPSETPGVLGTIGQYEVLEKIGQGGMGIVLKAKDTKLERIVAIKLLAPELACNPLARKRFLREAQAAAAVTHDHVVRIYAVSDSPQMPMLVMEYIDGQSLQQKLDRTGTLEVKEILRIGLQAALGLAAAHKQGLVHRDIKPANILLENGIQRVKITDFGLARAVDDIGMTQTGQITGTPQYMSPEQAQGDLVDYRSDLFSLGSVLYAMCTGRAAFRADSTVAVLRRVCDDQPRPIPEINPEVPLPLVDIVEQLMAKNPEDRFQSAEDVAEALSGLLAEIQQPGKLFSTPESRSQRPSPEGRRFAERFPPLLFVKLTLALTAVLLVVGITEATGVTRLAKTVVRIVTGEGTLIIETDDTSLQVTVEGQGRRQEVRVTGMGVNLTLKPGEYIVTASKDGKTVDQELVTVTRNGKNVVRISYEGGNEETGKALSDKMQRELALAVRAGRGEMGEAELNALMAVKHSIPDLLELPVAKKILELLASLPAESRKQLIERGYLKWPHAGLNEHYRESFATIVEMFLREAQEMGFGGKQTPRESTRDILKNADVGFAVIDFEGSQQAITFYVLMPHSPLPLAMPIVPSDPKNWEDLNLGDEQHDQLRELAKKPDSFYPPLVSESLLNPPKPGKNVEGAKATDPNQLTEVRQFQGHKAPVKQVALSPDGKLAVSGSGWPRGDRTVRLWDVETGKELRTLAAMSEAVMTVGFSPDGKLVAAGGFDGQVHIWDVSNGNKLTALPRQTEVVEDVAFSPDNRFLLAVGHKRAYVSEKTKILDAGKAVLWNLEDRQPVWQRDSTGWFKTGAFSPDGKRAYLGGFFTGAQVHVLDAKSGVDIEQYRDESQPMVSVEELAVSPDGQSVATALVSGSVRVWNTTPGGKQLGQNLDSDRLLTIAFTPNGSHLLAGGHGGKLHVLDAKTLEPVISQDHPSGFVWSVAAAPNGCLFLSAGGSVAKGDEIKNNGDYALRLWQLPEPLWPKIEKTQSVEARRFEGSHLKPITSVAISPDGKTLLSTSYDKTVRAWDIATSKEQTAFLKHTQSVGVVTYSKDGTLAASGAEDGSVWLWDPKTSKEIRDFKGHEGRIRAIAFSPDGKRLATGSAQYGPGYGEGKLDNSVRIWDIETGQEMRRLLGITHAVNEIAFSPDGKALAVAGEWRMVGLWNVESGEQVTKFPTSNTHPLSLAFSPDGQTLATGHAASAVDPESFFHDPENSVVCLWDVASGQLRRTLRGHSGHVNAVVFSPDGRVLLSGSGGHHHDDGWYHAKDNSLRVWNIASGELLWQKDIGSTVNSVAFTPDGQSVISGGGDLSQSDEPSVPVLTQWPLPANLFP